ncbi:olfactory receptor 52K1-like [Protopterus annectens]|uniref:olfactory receptor 52K1-like n=1 Tax=Protopterus annectens TaxID=7888 RepID=UPI001CFA6228|nr:olfactory receptor 52K1-like [Protopterus annectens]
MSAINISALHPPEFILTGFPGYQGLQHWIAIPYCIMYILIIVGNFTILFVVFSEQSLHQPMYYFICMLAIIDLVLSNLILPKLLLMLLSEDYTISFQGCLTQMFFIHVFTVLESSALLTMSFDRYVAICNPLRYSAIFSNSFIMKIVGLSITRGVVFIMPLPILASRLPYCNSNIISISYCDHMSVVKLACADTTLNSSYGLVVIFLVVSDMSFIVFSYSMILRAVLKLGSGEERQKALHTCGSHLCVVVFAYSSATFSFITHRFGRALPPEFIVVFACLYLILPAMLNPIIYGARTKEIRRYVLNT